MERRESEKERRGVAALLCSALLLTRPPRRRVGLAGALKSRCWLSPPTAHSRCPLLLTALPSPGALPTTPTQAVSQHSATLQPVPRFAMRAACCVMLDARAPAVAAHPPAPIMF